MGRRGNREEGGVKEGEMEGRQNEDSGVLVLLTI